MADYDDTYDDKHSRGKVSCPSFNGQAKDWKSCRCVLFQLYIPR